MLRAAVDFKAPGLYNFVFKPVKAPLRAEVAELADALASGASGRKVVEVQILSSAPAFAHRLLAKAVAPKHRRCEGGPQTSHSHLLLSTIHQPISTSGDRGICGARARAVIVGTPFATPRRNVPGEAAPRPSRLRLARSHRFDNAALTRGRPCRNLT